jgi:transcriptional regulator with XRE-family HTH domain
MTTLLLRESWPEGTVLLVPVLSEDRQPNTTLRAARQRLSLSQDDLARALREAGWSSCDKRTIQRYESGESVNPQYPALRALALVFKMSAQELGFLSAETQDEDEDVNRRQLLTTTAAELVNGSTAAGVSPHGPTAIQQNARIERNQTTAASAPDNPESMNVQHDDALDRRGLLQALGALGVAASPAIQALRHIQGSLEQAIGPNEDLALDEWQQIVAEYGYT